MPEEPIVNAFIWPLVIGIMLLGKANFLADCVMLTRGIAHHEVQVLLKAQIGTTKVQSALNQTFILPSAKAAIEQQIANCDGKAGQDLVDCLNKEIPEIEKIIRYYEKTAGGRLNQLWAWLDGVKNNLQKGVDFVVNPVGTIAKDGAVALLRVILFALQWAFINILEASLLLTALFAPVAMGLSILPLGAKPIVTWFSGFLALFMCQLAYNSVVGLVAVIVSKNNLAATDIFFLMFLAIFAPALSMGIAAGGGIGIYKAMSEGVGKVANFVTNTVVTIATQGAALLGKI
jgi:hypothetical protein